MKTITRLSVFLIISLLVCAHAATAARQKTAGAAQKGAVLLAVSKYEGGVSAEPVVIYRDGKYENPPVDEEKGNNAFAREYFRAGRKFRILSGGGEAGTLSIIKYQEPGCVGLVADATAETTARLGGRVKVLATDSQTLGRGAPSRRAPTEAERARAVELARAAYAKNRVAASLAAKMEVVNLTATDLDRDGRFELVGSFLAKKEGGERSLRATRSSSSSSRPRAASRRPGSGFIRAPRTATKTGTSSIRWIWTATAWAKSSSWALTTRATTTSSTSASRGVGAPSTRAAVGAVEAANGFPHCGKSRTHITILQTKLGVL